MRNILINASNLHVGGGVQAGSSIISELARTSKLDKRISAFASTEVALNLPSQVFESDLLDVKTKDTYGFEIRNLKRKNIFKDYSAVLTIFGPLYQWRRSFINITGFAQAWIIYPNNECYKLLSPARRSLTKIKFWIQGGFFKRADFLIVELEHVKEGLIKELGVDGDRIYVIHNCISSVYLNKGSWRKVDIPLVECDLRLGFLGRNYLHKNTGVFPAIAADLAKTYNIKAKIFVTFTDTEWQSCTSEFKEVCVNVGPLSVAQCPTFYKSLDAVVFPSLLECFSATPLETMAMEIPLFASDRPFNRDVCGDHAHYFDPLAPETAARAIAEVFANGGPNPISLGTAREHAINFSNPKERAEKYLALLMQCSK